MNQKGFAITAILYSILIIFVLLIASFLGILSNKHNFIINNSDTIAGYYDMNNTYKVCANLDNEYTTLYRGQYKITTPSYSGYLYLPANIRIKANDNSSIYVADQIVNFTSNDNPQYKLTDIKNNADYYYDGQNSCDLTSSAIVNVVTSASEVEIIKALPVSNRYTTPNSNDNPYYIYKVMATGYYQLEVWGAQGGYRSNANNGGKGAYAQGTVRLKAGDLLYIYVGSSGNTGGVGGGYNGGGTRDNFSGGGGASDIRLVPSDDPLNQTSLLSRILVASGGGSDGSGGNAGTPGGALTSTAANSGYGSGGGGATQTSPGVGTGSAGGAGRNGTYGMFGVGGRGYAASGGYAGAGGGGWYGGAGSYPDGSQDDDRGGAGGSSFVFTISTHSYVPSNYSVPASYYLRHATVVAGNQTMPNKSGSGNTTGNSGDGAVAITWLYKEENTGTVSERYTTPNTPLDPYYEYIVPKNGYYKLETWGAQGGYRSNANNGGKGGYASGIVYLNKGTKLYVYVGSSGNTGGIEGGYNGGGTRDTHPGGGGASDIRFISHYDPLNPTSLLSRLIVAGGGGSDGAGGNAGMHAGINGGDATKGYGTGGGGGHQNSAGIGSGSAGGSGRNGTYGGFGVGGRGYSAGGGYGGAGGGGWYGGAGSYPDGSQDDDRGGGGGSCYVWGELYSVYAPANYSVGTNYYAKEVTILSGLQSMPNKSGSGNTTGNTGDGAVAITWLYDNFPDDPLAISYTTPNTYEIPYYIYNVPQTGNYKLEVWGGQGGYRSNANNGGFGGYASGTAYLTKGTKLYVYVGSSGNTGGVDGGYNGGGTRGNFAGGGGASDIRLVPNNDPLNQTSLLSRFLVAGGGGSDGNAGKKGMYAGGLVGGSATDGYGTGGGGATQTSGGIGSGSAGGSGRGGTYGTFGIGGHGYAAGGGYGGAGGAGWYGGAGSYPDGSQDDDRAGGGGSSFALSAESVANVPGGYNVSSSYYLTNTSVLGGNETIPNKNGSGTTTGNTGDGAARITYID